MENKYKIGDVIYTENGPYLTKRKAFGWIWAIKKTLILLNGTEF